METLQVDKLDPICSSSQRRTYGVQERSLCRTNLKNCTINCLTFEENTRQPCNDNFCLCHALAFYLHGNQQLEEKTSKISKSILNKMDGLSPNQFKGVHRHDISIVEYLLTLNILLYDRDIVDRNIIGELAR